MILQPFGPWRSTDSRLWHLSLSVCLEGGRVWWGRCENKKRMRNTKETKNTASPLFVTSSEARWLLFWLVMSHDQLVHDYSFFFHFSCFPVAPKWLSDGHSLNIAEWRARWTASRSIISHDLPGEAYAASSKWQDWLSRFLSFLCDIWLFILFCRSCTTTSSWCLVYWDTLEIDK